jgi:predicted transglutaminase-like cysteine proteinase
MAIRRTLLSAVILMAAMVSISCGASQAAVAALEPVDVVTGWFDDGIVEGGKNKLVPSVTMKLRNKSGESIRSIQINAIFRRVGEQEMWGEHFGWAVSREGLAAGASTDTLVMRSALGYTGTQPRMQMLQNKEFIDAKVEIYLKQGSRVWAKLAEYPIQRQLLTQ